MHRIDIRCECNLAAQAFSPPHCDDCESRYPVKIIDISLGGAKIVFDTLPFNNDYFTLKLEDFPNIEIVAYVKFKKENQAIVVFYYDSVENAQKIIEIVRKHYGHKNHSYCPYCGQNHASGSLFCPHTQLSLNIYDPAYLNDHVCRTLLKRISWRLHNVDCDKAWSILSSLDKQMLSVQPTTTQLEIVGTSPAMLNLFSQIRKVAATDLPVLILGESGTGKELASKAIFERSDRKSKPFIVINCAAIPETLLEAELFGYERGAFTGAHTTRHGKFEHADEGTILLDEVGDLPQSLQAKLLRFLEEGTIERLGSNTPRQLDIRILAATNQDLESKVHNGTFRLDLYHRLSAFTITLPALRDRGADKTILAKFFLNKFSLKYNSGRPMVFSSTAIGAINEYAWPGNIREMINKIRKAVVIADSHTISTEDLGLHTSQNTSFGAQNEGRRKKIDKATLLETLDACSWNKSLAAKRLCISRPTLYKLTREYGLL